MELRDGRVPAGRMRGAERREQVLQAATRAFARTGYAGTTTDAVAREAGVSQPYVVRMFGTKIDLFLAVFERATDEIKSTFAQVVRDGPFDPSSDRDWDRLGAAYSNLVADRQLLLIMMHGFAASNDEQVGERARRCMAEIYELLMATGCPAERAVEFLAHGMLLNVLLTMRAPEHSAEPGPLSELVSSALSSKGVSP